ncbi:twin-arginine translocase TatA/TatE family subunit [Nonomuraea angiospora]|uniref:twin-arginine translocase TatA/TatE family subunit n=1 Tax=Nonomuraea angiospora TaxID=46172 RepID=UPI0034372F57
MTWSLDLCQPSGDHAIQGRWRACGARPAGGVFWLPETARAVGRSLRIFKAEAGKLHDDEPAEPPASGPSLEEQARRLEEQAARLRAGIREDGQAKP